MLSRMREMVVALPPMLWLARVKQRDSETVRHLTEARLALEHHREVMARARSLEVRVELHSR